MLNSTVLKIKAKFYTPPAKIKEGVGEVLEPFFKFNRLFDIVLVRGHCEDMHAKKFNTFPLPVCLSQVWREQSLLLPT